MKFSMSKLWLSFVIAMTLLAACGGEPKQAPAPQPAAAPTKPLVEKTQVADWCPEHGVPESICTRCNAGLIESFKKKGDWCEKHGLPDSQCLTCHPELEAKFKAMAPKGAAGGGHGHGEEVALGEVKLGEHTIQVTQAGKVEAGKEASFDLAFAKGKPMPGTVRGWIGVESAQGSMKGKFEKEGDAGMHGHIETPSPIPAGSKLWLEVETPTGAAKAAVTFRP